MAHKHSHTHAPAPPHASDAAPVEAFVGCRLKLFAGEEDVLNAANHAISVNPANRSILPHNFGFGELAIEPDKMFPDARAPDKVLMAVSVGRRWHTTGVRLTVSFLDNPEAALRTRILQHMNAWSQYANVAFTETHGTGQVRIARAIDGHWSRLGTDILLVPEDEATMNLQEFTMAKSDAEFRRVVRHETGHTLGFVHELRRAELVRRLKEQAVLDYYAAQEGWSEQTTRQQILTPIAAGDIVGTPTVDEDSIMCYPIPGALTLDGKPIPGGADINPEDAAFAAACYPK